MMLSNTAQRVVERFMQAKTVDVSGMRVRGLSLDKDQTPAVELFLKRLEEHATKIRQAGLGKALDGLAIHVSSTSLGDHAGRYDPFIDCFAVGSFAFVEGAGENFMRSAGQRFWQYLPSALHKAWDASKNDFATVFASYILDGANTLDKTLRDAFCKVAREGGARLKRQVHKRAQTQIVAFA
jgi:hypothetical protein